MKILLQAITAALLFLAVPEAQAMDGNDLLAGYNAYKRVTGGNAVSTDAYQAGLFDGYVSGVFDSAVGIALCAPSDVKSGQIQKVVGQFLETNPAVLQRAAVLLATQALMKAFPCR